LKIGVKWGFIVCVKLISKIPSSVKRRGKRRKKKKKKGVRELWILGYRTNCRYSFTFNISFHE